MSTLRGFVYRGYPPYMDIAEGLDCWYAQIHKRDERTGKRSWISDVGDYESQPEALAAVCQRLKDEAVVEDIVRRAEGKEVGA